MTPRTVQRTYLLLLLGNTLATSFIWGINTIFLLDAGLSNLEAFAANAFFTGGMVLFEVPTGIVADTVGRRMSYLLGTVTLTASTFLYVLLWQIEAPFWQWAVASMLLGLVVAVVASELEQRVDLVGDPVLLVERHPHRRDDVVEAGQLRIDVGNPHLLVGIEQVLDHDHRVVALFVRLAVEEGREAG